MPPASGVAVQVDHLDDYARMRDMQVDGVITDDPSAAGDWSKRNKAA